MNIHRVLALLLSGAVALSAAEIPGDGMTLPNGMRIVVENGNVRVENAVQGAGGSVSSSVSVRSAGQGVKVATVVTERNGVRDTRTVVIGPDGKASVGEAVPDAPLPNDAPAAPAAPEAGNEAVEAWLGVNCAEASATLREQLGLAGNEGLVIEHLVPEGPAGKAGLLPNDLLLALNRQPIGSLDALRNWLRSQKPGQDTLVDYLRKGRRETTRATLAKRATPQPSGAAGTMKQLQTQQPLLGSSSRTTVVGPDGKAKVIEGNPGNAFDAILNDPNVPETFKEQVRKQRETMRKFQEKHMPRANGKTGAGQ